MKRHAEHLEFSEENDLAARDEISRRYCRGWAVASQEHRKELKAAFAESNAAQDPEGAEWVDLREAKWEKRLRSLMKATGKTASDATRDAKSAAWKIKITRELRAKSTATKCVDRRTSCHGSPNKGL